VDKNVRKDLILFSLPLLGQGIAALILIETDIFMIGYFINAENVGLYSIARILSINLRFIFGAFGFLFIPIITKLFAENNFDDIKRIYKILTKWCFLITVPIFIIIFIYPEQIIELLFGNKYIEGKFVLQILSFGLMTHVFFGHNSNILVVYGKTELLMTLSLIVALINIILNASLIPIFGISGAAIATTLSFIIINLIISSYIYYKFKISAFSKNYTKSVLLVIPSIIVIYYLIAFLQISSPIFILTISFILFVILYYCSILITKSFDKEDISLMKSIEKRMGIKIKFLRNFIKKFI
jgi:O-antigen/teichoic acid export membrane protein